MHACSFPVEVMQVYEEVHNMSFYMKFVRVCDKGSFLGIAGGARFFTVMFVHIVWEGCLVIAQRNKVHTNTFTANFMHARVWGRGVVLFA